MADEIIADNSITIPSPDSEARVVLDWDDGQWYISEYQSINQETGEVIEAAVAGNDGTSGVKVAVWDKDYKYTINDIVGHEGVLYVAKQNTNQGNIPSAGTFWWGPVVDFTSIDSVTLEGRNLTEIIKDVLGGNDIADYYKKAETNNLILSYFNNVNAKKIDGWTIENISDDYISKILAAKTEAMDYTVEYLNDDTIQSFQQTLVDEFNSSILDDQVNQRN